MALTSPSFRIKLMLGLWFSGLLWSGCASAQVIPDSSTNSHVTATNRPQPSGVSIEGGIRAGSNLFHSFRQFSVPTGSAVIFNNSPDVQNIFSRVTGVSLSRIDGLIQANGAANVFLLNPNGILFGPNARLNIGGSFIATTATSVTFSDGTDFSAVDSQPSALLTVSAPIGLRLGADPAPIQVQGMGHRLIADSAVTPYKPYAPYRGLQVRPNQTLALIGGAMNFTGAILQAPNGRIEIGSVAQPGLVELQRTEQGFAAHYSDIDRFGTIRLAGQSNVEVAGPIPGVIHLEGGRIRLQGGSLISGTNVGPQSTGAIAVNAHQRLVVSGTLPNTNILNGIRQDNFGTGQGGAITIQTPDLVVQAGASIFSRNYGSGRGGPVQINAERIRIAGSAAQAPDVFSRVGTLTTAQGLGGNVSVSTRSLSLLDSGFLGTVNFLTGVGGGNARINADTITVQGLSPANVSSAIGAYNLARFGRSGNLTINTRILNAIDGGLVGTSSPSAGNAGNLRINASESISVSGYGNDESYPSVIASSITRPTAVYRQLFGLPRIPSGTGGNIVIHTPMLTIDQGGTLTVSNQGTGSAGSLAIRAEQIRLRNDATISALTQSGDGGNIAIQSDRIVLANRSDIVTNAVGQRNTGNGGNIRMNASSIVGVNNSDILANAGRGRGGSIDIVAQGIFGLEFRDQLTPENDINASSEFGVNGTVDITTPNINPDSGLIVLPMEVVDSSQQIGQACDINQSNSFVITGRGGVPTNPANSFSDSRPWSDVRVLPSDSVTPPPALSLTESTTEPHPLVEATGWRQEGDRPVELIASAPSSLTAMTHGAMTATSPCGGRN